MSICPRTGPTFNDGLLAHLLREFALPGMLGDAIEDVPQISLGIVRKYGDCRLAQRG